MVSNLKSSSIAIAVLSISLGLNLMNYYWLDILTVTTTIWGITKAFSSRSGLLDSFGLSFNAFNALVALFLLSISAAYIFNPVTGTINWKAIADLRWIWTFYAFYFAGTQTDFQKESKSLSILIFPTSLALCIILIKHTIQFGTPISPLFRIQGFYENPNHLALTVVLFWAFCFGLLITNHSQSKTNAIGLIVGLLLASLVLISTYSRSAWFAAVCVAIMSAVLIKSKRGNYLLAGFILLCFVIIKFNLFGLSDRIAYSWDMGSSGSQFSRVTVWKVAWQIFLDHPILGVGLEDSAKLFPYYYKHLGFESIYIVGHSHNQFLEVLAGAGILGFTFYISIFSLAAFSFFRRFKSAAYEHPRRALALSGLLVVIALTTSSFTDAPFRLHEVRNYVLILMGFISGYSQKRPC